MKVARVNGPTLPIRDSVFGLGGAAAVPSLGDLADVNLTGLADGDSIVYDLGTDTWGPGTGGGSSLPWFVVTDYGAVGDGTTDDTTAIDAAIADLNTATRGVLYFPAATYKVTAALTAITATCAVMGDGIEASKIVCTSATAVLLTMSANGATVRDIWLHNSATASAGSAIKTTAGNLNRYHDVLITSFYTGIKHEHGIGWAMTRLYIESVKKYGIQISYAASPDFGDWTISDTLISDAVGQSADAAIRIESSGGGKISGLKVNGTAATGYNHGIDLALVTSADTGLLQIVNSSIENIRGDGIHGTTSAATSKWGTILISNCQVALYSNNSGKAVSLVGTTAGDLHDVIVIDCHWITNGTARSAMQFTNCDQVTIGFLDLDGFNATHSVTTSTNVRDFTGGVAQVVITGTPTAGQVPVASSGTAAAWGPSSAVAALDDLTDVTITTPTTADRLRYNGSAWVNSAKVWTPVMVEDGATGLWYVVVTGDGDAVLTEV